MHPQLAAVVADLESAAERVQRLHGSLSRHAWDARPAPGRWSAAECVAHLNLTSNALLPLVRDALRRAREQGEPSRRRYRRNALGWVAWTLIAPEGGVKTRTTAAFAPITTAPAGDLLSEFIGLQSEIIACVRDADGLPLDRVHVRSPIHGRMSYPLYTALTLVPRHQHRHLRQAELAAQTCAPLVTAVAG